ncbi:uncharacterized protein KIAA1958 homolog isoform X1 [Hypomesus transpacificus]|uniref:uncharacterized protein KIAA1958 homolog isoform X1 n=2 Tax=Hypomesus transpacificus TaxID=137520 RepID=UPI001F072FC3|nr:uncharacterized protein KIAA1958 homolog isoform X1 [Hypomesus transpacificus]
MVWNTMLARKKELLMEDCLHTSSENLSKLVRWAHSHGTICSLIPGLKHVLTEGSHGNLTAMWGCGAGHAYHWPLTSSCRPGQKERVSCYQDNRGILSEAGPQTGAGSDRFLARASKAKGGNNQTRDLCDFSNCSEPSEADDNTEEFGSNLFDTACESSATDEDGEYEPQLPARKRGGTPGGPGGLRSEDRAVKRIKLEASEDYYYLLANGQQAPATDSTDPKATNASARPYAGHGFPTKPSSGDGDCLVASSSSSLLCSSAPHTSLAKLACGLAPQPPLIHQEPSQNMSLSRETRPAGPSPGDLLLGSEELLRAGETGLGELKAELELAAQTLASNTDTPGEAAAGPAPGEIERLRSLLQAEMSRSQLMVETISSLKQDKELLQQELTKKAELICDFLQDQLRPEKRRAHSSNHTEAGSSHMASFVEEAAFDSPVLFDSFEEVELHPLDRHRGLKSKRNRDGENTRVRMKNVVGVIARYMAALQEFKRSVSMKVAFDRVGVDRNTISRTAAIAELSLAAPEVFHALAPWDEKEETLAHYAHRCRQAMDDNIRAKIKSMKAKGDLLPIVSK